ncbi:MAG: hypothetical protein JJU36_02315 [Phycisphaeraceae bacterium]|nr:hypothetical protein [Phycisphaeraceae bacterium]
MKPVLLAAKIFLLVHLLAALGFVGWLWGSNRLTQERLHRVVEMFRLTEAQEMAQREAEAAALARAEQNERELAHLELIAEGPITVGQRIERQNVASDITRARIARLQEQIRAMQADFALKQQELDQRSQRLQTEMAEFHALRDQLTSLRQDEDFKRLLEIMERQPPRQAKTLMVQMIQEERLDHVVKLLRVMNPNTAAEILQQFRTPEEIRMAVRVLDQLNQGQVERQAIELPDAMEVEP